MKQTKHTWWTFSPWEADALRQYLEQLALEGWYPESIGTAGMKCRLGKPEKRRYAAVTRQNRSRKKIQKPVRSRIRMKSMPGKPKWKPARS